MNVEATSVMVMEVMISSPFTFATYEVIIRWVIVLIGTIVVIFLSGFYHPQVKK